VISQDGTHAPKSDGVRIRATFGNCAHLKLSQKIVPKFEVSFSAKF